MSQSGEDPSVGPRSGPAPKAYEVDQTAWVSPNHDMRALGWPPPDGVMLVLHYTGMASARAALERLCDAEAKVSAHYVVDEDGAVFLLVAEERRAWHAGRSFWRGVSDVNSASIGIEIVNGGHEFGLPAFPPAQTASLFALAADIVARHAIAPWNVVGHSDIAPMRKDDPGELFPWADLAQAGAGFWPGAPALGEPRALLGRESRNRLLSLLTRIGYGGAGPGDAPEERAAAIRAFQRRFQPARTGQAVDAETLALAEAVAAACPIWSGAAL